MLFIIVVSVLVVIILIHYEVCFDIQKGKEIIYEYISTRLFLLHFSQTQRTHTVAVFTVSICFCA